MVAFVSVPRICGSHGLILYKTSERNQLGSTAFTVSPSEYLSFFLIYFTIYFLSFPISFKFLCPHALYPGTGWYSPEQALAELYQTLKEDLTQHSVVKLPVGPNNFYYQAYTYYWGSIF